MSRNEIANMSVEERVRLMEEIWASFDRNDEEYPVPAWHEDILKERANSAYEDFVPFDEAKKRLRAALNAY